MSAPDGSPVGAERSIGQLFASATTEMSALVHDEIALAKAQLKQGRQARSGRRRRVRGGRCGTDLLPAHAELRPGVRHPHLERLEPGVCFLLSFAANVLVAGVLALIGVLFAKKAKKGQGPQKTAASVKESAAVLQNVKPHPREVAAADPVGDTVEAVARSSS
jgi:hypothetical protein